MSPELHNDERGCFERSEIDTGKGAARSLSVASRREKNFVERDSRYSKRTSDWCWDNKALRGLFRRQQLFVRARHCSPVENGQKRRDSVLLATSCNFFAPDTYLIVAP